MAWLDEHQPDDVATLRDPQRLPLRQPGARPRTTRPRVVGVLDWEMATARRPADGPRRHAGLLGRRPTTTSSSAQFRRQPTHLPGHADPRARSSSYYCDADGLLGHAGAVAVLRGVRAVPARRDRPADLLPLLPRADHQRGLRALRPGGAVPRAALQPDHRRGLHGSGAAGPARPGVVGRRRLRRALRDRLGAVAGCSARRWPRAGSRPTWCVRGAMRRHRRDRRGAVAAAGWDADVVEVDAGWDEFDHLADARRRAAAPFEGRAADPRRSSRRWFEAATDRWTGGEHDDEYDESFAAFGDAGRRPRCVVRRRRPGRATAVVFTCGGPIAVGRRQPARPTSRRSPAALWRRLNPVCVNSGVTKVVTGRRGTTLVSFNEHTHLDRRSRTCSPTANRVAPAICRRRIRRVSGPSASESVH